MKRLYIISALTSLIITLLPGLMGENIGYKPFKTPYPCFFPIVVNSVLELVCCLDTNHIFRKLVPGIYHLM